MQATIYVNTSISESLTDITDQINSVIQSSGYQEGICVVYIPHTTAAILVNSGLCEGTPEDIVSELHRLIPTRVDFHHTHDTPSDAAGHIKSSIIGVSLTLIFCDGKLVLGSSQSVMLFEFDGPRERQVILKLIKER